MTTRRTSKITEPPAAHTRATGISGDPNTDAVMADARTSRTSQPDEVPASSPAPASMPVSHPDTGDEPTTVPDPDDLPVSTPIPLTQPATAPDSTLADRLAVGVDGDGVQARVEVLVAHDQVLRGETGVVELTERVRALIDRGYLRLLGIERSDDGRGPDPVGEVRVQTRS